MAWDEGLADTFREDLAEVADRLEERRMFGGLCFMLDGHMLCGVHKGGAMVRVGKDRHAQALAMDGVSELAFTGRPMGGLVDVSASTMADDEARAALLALAMENVRSLPPR
ncbi:hypothetical protein EF888_13645 [Silicimonas algicola]|uniref:TfoX-like protein n=1 Tax=Silicimonas algicola TaxID=1826607 RepID=A0A316G9A5_9RHOB|nr:TfoX/Sxy family protein [Silicimonas algicola]AZQ68085.1 hypothetical protein EF888_13645 [Silicimonas algicola]PWK57458.1 TfoX-like protein [Silicimonas algicola]